MKRFLAGALAGATTLTLAVGCAEQIEQLEPKLEIKKAAAALSATGKAGFTLKVGGNVDDLIAFAKKESGTEPGAFTDEDADTLRKLYNSSFTLAWDKMGDGVTDDRASVSAVIDGVTGTELRIVDQVAYVKAPVADLATKFGVSKSDLDAVRKEMGPAIKGVDTLFDGGWISISVTDVKKFSEGTTGVAPSTDPAQNEKLAAEVKASAESLFESADVVRDSKDKTHLVVTTTTVKAYEQAKRLMQAMEKIGGQSASGVLDEALGSEMEKPPADKPIVFDLWIDKGEFRAFEINMLQFADGSTGRAALRVELASGVEISAPEGAKKIDLTEFFSTLGAGAGDLGTPKAGGAGDAKEWAEMIGRQAMLSAVVEGDQPALHLKQAATDMALPGMTVKVVRSGVAQVTMGKDVACVTVPSSATGEPKVVAHAC
ncbi:hypothetical protein [Actinoplanes regularis]|uniref:Lipoprotein n=1 Tax=Actinoplanes regularis TaxID=52697 RepID=A0A239JP44_9ACTN|nr:hypothetical protein [Actinoplanes regularis]GIE92198.1 hypothetical protein Are01nite_86780 [Actinoplanes regularis]SNT07590.1 hypothetical protein SAMN06264365_1373 [Actinoplanes regularis]